MSNSAVSTQDNLQVRDKWLVISHDPPRHHRHFDSERRPPRGGLLTITRVLGQITGVAVLPGRSGQPAWPLHPTGRFPSKVPPATVPAAQVDSLHTTFVVAGMLMAASVVARTWGMRRERQDRQAMSVATAEL